MRFDDAAVTQKLRNLQQQLGAQNWQRANALADKIRTMHQQTLDAVYAEGLITDEAYKTYTGRGKEYIPLHRIMDQVEEMSQFARAGSIQVKQTLFSDSLEGSSRVNVDPFTASANALAKAQKEIRRNQVVRSWVDLAANDPQGLGSITKAAPSGYKPKADEAVISYFDKGVRKNYVVPRLMGDALEVAKPGDVHTVGRAMQFFKGVFQRGTTVANLAFAVPNVIRDAKDMAFLSKSLGLHPADTARFVGLWFKSVKDALTENMDAREEFLTSGAAFSSLQKAINPEAFTNAKEMGIGKMFAKGRIIHGTFRAIENFNNALEEATKISTYKMLREKGWSPEDAAWETRNYGGSPDFGARGTATDAVNLMVMFFNANVRGVARSFGRIKEDPGRALAWFGAMFMASLALDNYNSQ
jgi:hypothetical protein